MQVLGLQMCTEEGAVERNRARASEALRFHAAREKPDIAVFPEIATCGYAGTDFRPWAEPADGASVGFFSRLASELDVCIGFGFAEAAEGKVYNAYALIEPGRKPFIYRKIHLHHGRPGNDLADEPRFFAPGNALGLVDTRLGRLGIMTCYDGFFPEVPRSLVLRGASVIIWPMRCGGSLIENSQARVRALDNMVPIVAVDGSQTSPQQTTGGHSAIFDHIGNSLCSFQGTEGVVRAAIDPAKAERDRREAMDGLALYRVRRPDLYGAVVDASLKPWREKET